MTKEEIIKKVRDCGVVGAGGGGFPTHMKISTGVNTVIANGVECEPILSTDKYLMETAAEEIIEGLKFVKETAGADRLVIALKKKYQVAIDKLEKIAGIGSEIELVLLDDYYPAGDEVELVFNVTGRLVPEGGIPPDIGAMVINVNSLVNITRSVKKSIPVTTRWITVAGELEEPYVSEVPIGMKIAELIEAGVPKIKDYVIIAGGPMMGKIVDDSFSVTKLMGGILVLEQDSVIASKYSLDPLSQERRAKSVCDQCYDCTITCPRNLIGHDLSPHMMMRTLFLGSVNESDNFTNAYLCSDCGLCDMFSCPMELSPRSLLKSVKLKLGEQGIKNPHNNRDLSVHSEKEFRKVPQNRLIVRLGLAKYNNDFAVKDVDTPDTVSIPLKQHAGIKSIPVVEKGDRVNKGDLIGDINDGAIGAMVHSSISGVVSEVNENHIGICRA